MTPNIVPTGSACEQATQPPSSTSTRRAALRGATALAAATLAPALPAQAAEPVDPHPAWAAESARIKAEIKAMFGRDEVEDDEHYDRLVVPWLQLDDQIVDTPARTVAGMAVQLRVIMEGRAPGNPDYLEDRALRNALAMLERLMAGSA